MAPPPPSSADSASPLHTLSDDLRDYLDELPLAVCIFNHASLEHGTTAPPVYQNRACDALLRQGKATRDRPSATPAGQANGTDEHGDTGAEDVFTDCMDQPVRDDLRRWLLQGLHPSAPSPPAPASPSPNHTSPAPSRPPLPSSLSRRSSLADPSAPSVRRIFLKLHDRISWPPIPFRAAVRQGYTILTQLPPSELAKGGHIDGDPTVREQTPPMSPEVEKGEQRSGKEIVGQFEIDAERAKDANTLEGMAYTLWHAPMAIFRCNRQLSIVQTNPAWRDVAKVPLSESPDAWPTRIHPEDVERVMAHYARFARDLPNEKDEFEFRWKPLPDGTEQWCSAVIQPAMIDGSNEGYVCYMMNINKHKALATASELRERTLLNELAILSDTCQVGLSRHAVDGAFLSVNKAWWAITKVPEGSDLNKWEENLHPDDSKRVLDAWTYSRKNRTPLSIQFRWAWDEVCLVQCNLNHDDPDKATGWIGSVTNVTSQAKAEEAVLNLSKEREARAKKEAEEAEERRKIAVEEKRQQELLIDVTSHEIRNPISAILQNSDFTRSSLQSLRSTLLALKHRDALPSELDGQLLTDLDEDIEALDSITECGLAQERIANDILGLAQIQLSKYNITPVEFDLATSLRNICRMFKSECRSKGIELKLVIGSSLARLGPRARVFADPARLTQVLVNLLSNAIRFTAKSEVRQVTLAVEVSSIPPDRDAPLLPPEEMEMQIEHKRPIYLFFSVEDTGPGMTEEETGRLFAKFTQGSPFTHTAWGGSGLGLWIARNLCELQAGRIEVASTVGKGSIFRCFITARSVDTGPAAKDLSSLPVVEGITGPNAHRGETPKVYLATLGEDKKALAGLTVLCCEDNQINRTVLKKQLNKEGCAEVLLACDGQEGLDILNSREAGAIDCILMDIEMPVMDGLAATRAIRTAEQQGELRGHQRIVGLTGNARHAQKQLALDAGMDTVVTKPYKIPDLIDKIIGAGEALTGPLSASNPPTPNEIPSEALRQSGQATLAPTDKPVGEPLGTQDKTTVVNISGEERLSSADKTFARKTLQRHGEGAMFPPSMDDPDSTRR
ncbi:hypothetical protein JCM10207_000881 [Rhodosporidiobolus poonsookiae]